MKECPECGEEMFETIEHLQEYLVCPNCHHRESKEEEKFAYYKWRWENE